MQMYRVKLRLRSGLVTPLAADTLWGHLAWGLRWSRGNAALEAWLERYERGDAPLVLSEPFPADMLPRPLLATPPSDGSDKERSRVAWIPLGDRAWSESVTHAAFGSMLDRAVDGGRRSVRGERSFDPEMTSELHAAINRLTGGTASESGGTLYATDRIYYRPNQAFDVWCLSGESETEIERLFRDGLQAGYGRDAASGAGHLVVESIERAALPQTKAPNAYLVLGPARPTPSDPAMGFTRFDVRCGRLGGDFAIGATPNGSFQRQKRPILMLERGSVLLSERPVTHVGSLVGGVHDDPAIRHYAMSPLLPIRLADEIVALALEEVA